MFSNSLTNILKQLGQSRGQVFLMYAGSSHQTDTQECQHGQHVITDTQCMSNESARHKANAKTILYGQGVFKIQKS